ncbi:hypothetical protein [Pseudolysinimonas sp.]|jgi:hypothetical protein|uniref:hypothetical protein n=1 Tax=Pseudolysinimonas sp. TaxID=2680009 RepID=UPI003783A49E
MSRSPSGGSGAHPHSFATIESPGLPSVQVDLPSEWVDGGVTYTLTRLEATAWEVAVDGVQLGLLTHLPPMIIGDEAAWRIGDPNEQSLGVGVSWASWEDAVANLGDYRREY